jgi:hypothetical protein
LLVTDIARRFVLNIVQAKYYCKNLDKSTPPPPTGLKQINDANSEMNMADIFGDRPKFLYIYMSAQNNPKTL